MSFEDALNTPNSAAAHRPLYESDYHRVLMNPDEIAAAEVEQTKRDFLSDAPSTPYSDVDYLYAHATAYAQSGRGEVQPSTEAAETGVEPFDLPRLKAAGEVVIQARDHVRNAA